MTKKLTDLQVELMDSKAQLEDLSFSSASLTEKKNAMDNKLGDANSSLTAVMS